MIVANSRETKESTYDTAYEDGRRTAWRRVLAECLGELGYLLKEERQIAQLVKEREETIAILRYLCRDFGDNEWNEELNLADIIEKHLGDHLWDRRSKE